MRFERRGFGGRRFGGRQDFGSSDMPKPVKVGEEYDVEISEVGSKGDGIARVKNFVVFVNGTKQGEKTRIKITDVRDKFAIGEKVSEGGQSEEVAAEETEAVVEEASEETVETTGAEEETEE